FQAEDGIRVFHVTGVQTCALPIFAARGANLVRARLWHNPNWTAYSTLDDVKRTFERARDAGMSTLLDFHYSDNWADPGAQAIPRSEERRVGKESHCRMASYQHRYT